MKRFFVTVSFLFLAIPTISNAEPVEIASKWIVDSSQISARIHPLSGDGYLAYIYFSNLEYSYGCPMETNEENASELLLKMKNAISDGSIDMVKDLNCNLRREPNL